MTIQRGISVKSKEMLGGLLASTVWLGYSPVAFAQEAEDSSGLGEIVVTATKRETNLQQTPIAISVLGSEDLANRNVQSLLDLRDGAIPSLKVAPFFSRGSALIMNIRGIGVQGDSNQPARDQGVGVYIDGVYLGRPQGLGSALYDVERIEVLKGPQGTLFGRNTEGGAVSIVTRKPSGEFGLRALAGIGNFGGYRGELHLDLPEAGNLAFKLDAVLSTRGGTIKNPLAGAKDFNEYERRGLHARVLWTPSEKFTADYSFDISYDATTPLYAQAVSAGSLVRAPLTPLQPTRARQAVTGAPQEFSVGKSHGLRLTLEYKATDELLIKSINSYRRLSQSQFDNGSGLASALTTATVAASANGFNGVGFARYSLANFEQDQFSTELQAIGEFDRVNFVGGAMYFQENVEDNARAFNTLVINNAAGTSATVLSLNPLAQRIDRSARVKSESVGVFGQATWTPGIANDMFKLTLGARWTRDEKTGELFIVNGLLPVVDGVSAARPLNASWSRVDPLVNIAVDLSDDIHLYGKWSTGYKSGGANSRSLRFAPFDPETVSVFEIGAKTEFWDNKARFNLAAYTGRYKDIQLDFFATFTQVVNGVLVNNLRTTSETVNAPGNGRVRGFEADLSLAPIAGLTLSANYAYAKVRIPATQNPFPQANGALITVPVPIYATYTPEHAASGSIDYIWKGEGFDIAAHLSANWDSGFFANATDPGFNSTTGQVTIAQPKGDKPFIVNGRLSLAEVSLAGTDAKVTVSLWGRNLFNEQHAYYRSFNPTSGGTGIFNEPRTFGADIQIKF
jgi:iron complex outermembrane recepter protein